MTEMRAPVEDSSARSNDSAKAGPMVRRTARTVRPTSRRPVVSRLGEPREIGQEIVRLRADEGLLMPSMVRQGELLFHP
jgi:hypothetical protein